MSLYVRIFTNFYTSRKTAHLQAIIGTDAFWVPPRIWAYAADNQPDGNLAKYPPQVLANLIGYTGDAQRMHQALLEAGFLDADGKIHDWNEHNGYHVSYHERAKAAAEARWSKKKKRKDTERKGKETSNASSMALLLLNYLNEKAGRNFKECEEHLKLIKARIEDCQADVDGCKQMIDRQCSLWKGDVKMDAYLRPQTLFAKGNFRSYYDDRSRPVVTKNGQANPRQMQFIPGSGNL